MNFIKMHGLGNDFVILDTRINPITLSKKYIKILCNRRIGIGSDQLIILEKPSQFKTNVYMRIFNSNGNEVEACGNATRCVGYLIYNEIKKKKNYH